MSVHRRIPDAPLACGEGRFMTHLGPSTPQRKLAEFEPPPVDASVAEALDDSVARQTAGGTSGWSAQPTHARKGTRPAGCPAGRAV